MSNEQEIDFAVEADKFITIFHKVFHEYHENRIKKEEGETNVKSDSVDELEGDFFSKLASKIRKTSKEKTKKTKESNS